MAAIVGALRADLSANWAQFRADLGKAGAALDGFSRKADRLGKNMQRVGAGMTAAFTAPMLAAGGVMLKVAGDFEAGMNRVQGATMATAGEFNAMKGLAAELGENTQFSATQAASAMETLAKNGLDVQSIMGGATDASLLLAAATDTDLKNAADIATDAMLQFKKEAGELGGVVDNITGTLFNSKFGIDDYRLALAQAGGVAGSLGVDFKEFNAVIAGTSSVFASGSDAGTSFKSFLTRLAPESERAKQLIKELGLEFFDANGQMKSMGAVAQELQDKLGNLRGKDLQETMTILFGRDAMRTALALMQQGEEGVNDLVAAIDEIKAADQAEARLKGFNGQMKLLLSSLQGLAIAIAESGLLEFMTQFIVKITEAIRWMAQMDPAMLRIITVGIALAGTLGPLALALGAVVKVGAVLLRSLGPMAAGLLGLGNSAAGAGAKFSRMGLAIGVAGAAMATWFLDKDGAYQKFWAARGRELGIYIAKLKYGSAEVEDALERIRRAELKAYAEEQANAARAQREADARRARAEELAAELERLSKETTEFGTESINFGDDASELDTLRESIYPVATALEQYEKDMKAATAAGIDGADAAEALSKKAYDAAGGFEAFAKYAGEVPAEIQKLVEADKALADSELSAEAQSFARDVEAIGSAVEKFGTVAVTPLEQAMERVDAQYAGYKDRILDLIDRNRELASESPAAAAALAELETQLGMLEGAYMDATAAARAQVEAQEHLRDLAAARAADDTQSVIRDLQEARGDNGFMSDRMKEIADNERRLAEMRRESVLQQIEYQIAIDEAKATGDEREMLRLQTLLGLEQQLFDEIEKTTGAQIEAAERLQDLYKNMTEEIADALTDMLTTWEFDLGGLARSLGRMATQSLVTPGINDMLSQGVQGLGGLINGGFGGFFAEGGTLNPGQWGIVGEDGPEIAYAGNRDLTISPGMGGSSMTVVQNIQTPDLAGFRSSERQIARQAKRSLGMN